MKPGGLPIDPQSLRGRVAVAVAALLEYRRANPDEWANRAAKSGLTPDSLLAAAITEGVLDTLGLDGREVHDG